MDIILNDDDISKINKYVEPDSMVILDLHNTLIRSTTTLGSPQWFFHTLGQAMKAGLTRSKAIETIYDLYMQVMSFATFKLIDPNLHNHMAQWQAIALAVLGITQHNPLTAKQIDKQLRENEILFAPQFLAEWEAEFTGLPYLSCIHNGVIFTSELNPKDTVIAKLFATLETELQIKAPQRLIFVDDIPDNVQNVGELCERLKIEYVGLRYSKLDAEVANFNPMIAKLQLEHLGKILPDSVVQEFMTALKTEETNKNPV